MSYQNRALQMTTEKHSLFDDECVARQRMKPAYELGFKKMNFGGCLAVGNVKIM